MRVAPERWRSKKVKVMPVLYIHPLAARVPDCVVPVNRGTVVSNVVVML